MKVAYGPIITNASGSLAGFTAAGTVLRRRTIPASTHTAFNPRPKNRFQRATVQWSRLPAATRRLWNNWAANHPAALSLTGTRYKSGRAAYISYNIFRQRVLLAPVTTPPTTTRPPALFITSTSLSIAANYALSWTPSPTGANIRLWVDAYWTPSQAATAPRNRYIAAASPGANITSPRALGPEFAISIGTVPIGALVHCRAYLYNQVTGLIGTASTRALPVVA